MGSQGFLGSALMFEGFMLEDFAAFEERKWKYKKYDHERGEVREKMSRLRDSLNPIISKIDTDFIPKISLARIGRRKKDVQSMWLAYVLSTYPSYTKNPQLCVEIGDGWLYIGIGIPSYSRRFRDNLAKLMIEDPEIIQMALSHFNSDEIYFRTVEKLDVEQLDNEEIQSKGREMLNTTGKWWVSLGVYYENRDTILSTEPQNMIDHIAYVFEWLYPIFVYVATPRRQNKRLFDWARKAIAESSSGSSEQPSPIGRTELFDISGHSRKRRAGASFISEDHKKLANAFFIWLNSNDYEDVRMEVHHIDITFRKNAKQYMAELKPSSEGGGRGEIREALGQLIDYSFFGTKSPMDGWIIVLDTEPGESEKQFVCRIREELDERFNLAWKTEEEEFVFVVPLSKCPE